MNFKTEQENFWYGEFGDEYIDRNDGDQYIASSLNLLTKALNNIERPESIIEFGANIGLNLRAIKLLFPKCQPSALEINRKACEKLRSILTEGYIFNQSILNFEPPQKYDLVIIKGVLIHQNPDDIEKVYEKLIVSCKKYLLISEYYSPNPVKVDYRNHSNRLFKRDWAGEILDKYKFMKLIDYGFVYHRDAKFPLDDENWFLLEKIQY